MNEKNEKKENIFKQILINSIKHIDRSLYSYLCMLIKYIFLGNKGIKNKAKEKEIITKLTNMTNNINKKFIKIEANFIKIEPLNETYTLQNFTNILNFIKSQNSMFAGDIMESALMLVFSFCFETDKTNEFGKYIYVNISRLRDTSYHDLSDWFKKGENRFQPPELRNFKELLDTDVYISEENKNKIFNPNKTLLQELITEVIRYKLNFISSNKGNSKTFDFINGGKLDLIKLFLDKFRDMKNMNSNLTMVDKDFTSNSIAFIYYYLFEEEKIPPIKMIRCFLTAIYIYYQNEHSPLMNYTKPKVDSSGVELVPIPFAYSLRGAFVEGRFSNIIISPIKLEPKISVVNFGQNNIREWGLFELGKSITMNPNIKSIILKISLLRGYYLDFFNAGLGIYDNYKIDDLNLSMNYLKEESAYSLVKFISHLKNLKTLNLSANDLKGGPKHIFIYLKDQFRKGKCKLENLYLNNITMDDSAFYELGELIKSRYCKIKRLSLGGNNKSNVVNFLKQVKYNRNLEELNIFKCGFRNTDIDDICRIISNTNIKHLNLFKNDFKHFGKCLSIVFRTKLIKKNNKKFNYFIDRSASLMTLDLSNNMVDLLNPYHINLINDIIQDNSTLSCLDISHIVYGPYPDRSKTPKSDTYINAVQDILIKTLENRKDKFSELLFNKYQKEILYKEYEQKNDIDKLKYRNENLDEKIEEIIKEEDAQYHLYLKEKCKNIIKDLKNKKLENRVTSEYDYLLEEVLEDEKKEKEKEKNKNIEENEENNEEENEDENKEEKIMNKILNYMKYKRDKKDLDKINLDLGEKNLILI